MTEEEARRWFVDRWPATTMAKLERFLAMVIEENDRQNLIAPSTVATIWSRHAVDSAQLLGFAPATATTWLDVGSGGGFPGVVTAMMFGGTTTLVEPRRKRADFLESAVRHLGLSATVVQSRVQAVKGRTFDLISARAVASVEGLLEVASPCASPMTRWLLPRGRIEPTTLAMLKRRRIMFHVEQSISDPASAILIIGGQPA